MFKKILSISKKIVISAFLLYGFNVLIEPLSMMIPINFVTVGMITFLGVPALVGLVFTLLVIY